jgi:hypothetical protein
MSVGLRVMTWKTVATVAGPPLLFSPLGCLWGAAPGISAPYKAAALLVMAQWLSNRRVARSIGRARHLGSVYRGWQ